MAWFRCFCQPEHMLWRKSSDGPESLDGPDGIPHQESSAPRRLPKPDLAGDAGTDIAGPTARIGVVRHASELKKAAVQRRAVLPPQRF